MLLQRLQRFVLIPATVVVLGLGVALWGLSPQPSGTPVKLLVLALFLVWSVWVGIRGLRGPTPAAVREPTRPGDGE